jgi:phosphomannomutase
MARLRDTPPDRLAGFEVTVEDLLTRPGLDRTDALIMSGGDGSTSVRLVVRPSGTEPKLKSYIEVRCGAAGAITDLDSVRDRARALQDELVAVAGQW